MFIAASHQRAIKISQLHGLCFNIEQSLNNAIISGASCAELQPLSATVVVLPLHIMLTSLSQIITHVKQISHWQAFEEMSDNRL